MSKNICTKFYPDWLSLRWVFKICRMLRMESQIYNGVDTCYLTLDKRGRLPFNGHHISNKKSSRRKMASVHCNSDRPQAQPGSSVPTRVMTRDPGQKLHHSKALQQGIQR